MLESTTKLFLLHVYAYSNLFKIKLLNCINLDFE